MAQTPGWYLLAYDIADPRRLRRIHRAVRAEGVAVQRSVFLVHGTLNALNRLLDHLETLMDPRLDDLRAYPVDEPAALWLGGQRVIQGALLTDGPKATAPPSAPRLGGWRNRL
ncbi:MAG: CRISPR-associated endonuclease Cas2 [Chromatiaceae bacterium]|nr:CRISPR-associated endonuclease Cas2 [Chromatiaceae bacterium]